MTIKRRKNPLLGQRDAVAFDVKQLRSATELRDVWQVQAGRRRNEKGYRRRFMRLESAEEALGPVRPCMCDLIVSTGQFSLCELVVVALEQLGPCYLTASTWTIGAQDVETLRVLRDLGTIVEPRFVLDYTFARRAPKYAHMMRTKFGEAALRVTANHAKWVTLRSVEPGWNLCVTTTMNLNQNPRLEILWIHEDEVLVAFFERIVDEIWRRAGEGFGGSYHQAAADFQKLGDELAGESLFDREDREDPP